MRSSRTSITVMRTLGAAPLGRDDAFRLGEHLRADAVALLRWHDREHAEVAGVVLDGDMRARDQIALAKGKEHATALALE
jgi:hypothetical protein